MESEKGLVGYGGGRRRGRTGVELRLELVHVRQGAGEPVDALHIKTKKVDGLDALVHNHGNG